jgi:hypothetical protein
LYDVPMRGSSRAKCIILPSVRWKLVWDFYIVFLLLVVSVIVPFRLAFYPDNDVDWIMIYLGLDFFFFIDMIFTFFTATVDMET